MTRTTLAVVVLPVLLLLNGCEASDRATTTNNNQSTAGPGELFAVFKLLPRELLRGEGVRWQHWGAYREYFQEVGQGFTSIR